MVMARAKARAKVRVGGGGWRRYSLLMAPDALARRAVVAAAPPCRASSAAPTGRRAVATDTQPRDWEARCRHWSTLASIGQRSNIPMRCGRRSAGP